MELTQAIQILNEAKNKKQNEIAVFDLALLILGSNFIPELQVLENARMETENARMVIAIKQKEIETKDFLINEKQAVIDELTKPTVEEITK